MASASVEVGSKSIPRGTESNSLESPAQDTAQKRETSDRASDRAAPRKRRRIVISCTECHRRKQKCNRKLPCDNCISRHKEADCKYQTGAPTGKEDGTADSRNGTRVEERSPGKEDRDSIPSKVANFGYSQTGASTLGFLKKIEGANPDEPLSRLDPDAGLQGDHVNIRDRYKALIRQLPARTYLDSLVELFFQDFNWQYDPLDRDVFERQLAEWHNLPYNVFTNGGPQALSPDLRAFPALLFQVLAIALLVLPPTGPDHTFESLKYNGNMTFEDLALDYSESGVAILSLLGKRHMSITTVLAGFLRASFLKYSALVTEAWHAIGSAIRDAQEIGLHRDSLDPKPASHDAEAVLENQWEIQRRRKIWMILVGWDLHTGIVLGRPTTIDVNSAPPSLPVDAPFPRDRSKTPITPRGENDPPTPLTRAIWAHHAMYPMVKILDLEREGPMPKNFDRVDKLHQELVELEETTPPFFRRDNPDTRFDSLPDCYWIPSVRATLPQLMSFNFMALHRPYIFTRAQSRTEALQASLNMLDAQRQHFRSLKPHQYKTFTLFFGTFDAIVLMASIYILFPKEHPELVQNAIQHFQFARDRFQAMSDRNALAKAALGVLHAIYLRLKKAVGITCSAAGAIQMIRSPLPFPYSETSRSASASMTQTTASTSEASPSTSEVCPNGSAASTNTSFSGPSRPSPMFTPSVNDSYPPPHPDPSFDWPSDFDWSSVQPIYATGDLVYNDLNGSAREDHGMQQWGTPNYLGDGEQPWQFEGDFGNDTVWNLLNQFPGLS